MRRTIRSLLVFSVLLGCHTVVHAQGRGAEVWGTIVGSTGAPVPYVKLVLRNAETGNELRTFSDWKGEYHFRNLGAGTYQLSAEAPGFRRREQIDIRLVGEQIVRLDPKLRGLELKLPRTLESALDHQAAGLTPRTLEPAPGAAPTGTAVPEEPGARVSILIDALDRAKELRERIVGYHQAYVRSVVWWIAANNLSAVVDRLVADYDQMTESGASTAWGQRCYEHTNTLEHNYGNLQGREEETNRWCSVLDAVAALLADELATQIKDQPSGARSAIMQKSDALKQAREQKKISPEKYDAKSKRLMRWLDMAKKTP